MVVMATSLSTFGPRSNTRFLEPSNNPIGISIGSAVFAQMTAECLYFTMGCPFPPPQNCPFPWGDLDPHTWFPGPTGVLNPNGILIDSAVFFRAD